MTATDDEAVCTGYAITCAAGGDVDTVLATLRAGEHALGEMDAALPFGGLCGRVTAPLDRALDAPYDARQSRLAVHLAGQLADVVAAAVARWGAERVALVVGTSTGGVRETERALAGDGGLPAGYSVAHTHGMGATVDVLAATLGVRGPRWVVSTACSSGAKALGAARRLLRASAVDAVVAGGIDSLCNLTLRGFHSLGILSPAGCRPFSAEREGIAIGEGGALLCLEREGEGEVALRGVGESSDAHHMSAPQPQGLGAEAAMASALAQAGIAPADVALVNAHGTGTKLNDAAESAAIARLLGERVPVTSTKGYMGHLLGAAGAVEAALCVAALERGWSPATLGCDPLDPALRLAVQRSETRVAGDFALSNSLAFGGSNASVLWGRRR